MLVLFPFCTPDIWWCNENSMLPFSSQENHLPGTRVISIIFLIKREMNNWDWWMIDDSFDWFTRTSWKEPIKISHQQKGRRIWEKRKKKKSITSKIRSIRSIIIARAMMTLLYPHNFPGKSRPHNCALIPEFSMTRSCWVRVSRGKARPLKRTKGNHFVWKLRATEHGKKNIIFQREVSWEEFDINPFIRHLCHVSWKIIDLEEWRTWWEVLVQCKDTSEKIHREGTKKTVV